MKFRYRGAEYQDQMPSDAQIQTERTAQYRGHAYTVVQPSHPGSQARAGLSYRGVPYRVTETGKNETLTPRERAELSRAKPSPVRCQSPLAVHTREQMVDASSQVHRQTIMKYLQQRMRIARAKRDVRLMNQLEAEMRNLELS
ncbi:MAG: DUF4278 domain-containing protein [Pegethrix bostrychoides GSE-TBD4-15B]|jgi:hypothetical protein|uniref:DUF4278 domain-containing protein n=1 Tax=Pegethrix bostrychoides GSE-TBD4-15B TaxID=2839662 RepID=A0A951P7L9_9CYAN|nr:DUF4278 domain-containing protein [Pegethrix bostrychoides GSE-TBD4-15B]